MPRRRRPVRPVRRPNFSPAPVPSEIAEDERSGEDAPTFADEPAVTVPGLASGGPVETRPERISRDARAQGRRMAQLRRSAREDRVTPRAGATGQLPTFSAGYITGELRQITITTVAMVALIVVLALVLR